MCVPWHVCVCWRCSWVCKDLLLLLSCSLALFFSCSSSLTLVPEPFLCLCVRSLSNDLFDGERASQSLRARLECGSTAVSSRVLSLSGPLGLTDGTATLPWILEVPPPPPYTPYPKERANTYRDLTDAQTSDRIPIGLRPITSDRIPIDLRPHTSDLIPHTHAPAFLPPCWCVRLCSGCTCACMYECVSVFGLSLYSASLSRIFGLSFSLSFSMHVTAAA
jgi:hypothetical protein